MNKKRDFFLFFIPFLITLIFCFMTSILYKHIEDFSKSYIIDAQKELNCDIKQVVFVIEPLLKRNDEVALKKYCSLFENEKLRITVINENGNIIADSLKQDNFENHANRPEILAASNGEQKLTQRYSSTMKKEMLYQTTKLTVNDKSFIVRVSISAKNVSLMIINAEENIITIFLVGVFVTFFLTIFIILKVRKPFIKLQNSTIEIANGNLEKEIFVPHSGVLWELASAVNRMSRQLKNQIIKLKQLEDFRSEFIANVSHEIKTPLTSILSSVDLLENSGFDVNIKDKCLRIIKEQSFRLNKLIQDIISLADIERKQVAQNKDFDTLSIETLLENVYNFNKEICDNVNIELIIENDAIANVSGDIYLLEQALNNLISNAIKYSKTDKIIIKSYSENNQVFISVKDFGIGIEQKHIDRIFERFYRVDKTRSRELGGTGLGLSIVKNIIKLHGGDIFVMSCINEGTEFVIKF